MKDTIGDVREDRLENDVERTGAREAEATIRDDEPISNRCRSLGGAVQHHVEVRVCGDGEGIVVDGCVVRARVGEVVRPGVRRIERAEVRRHLERRAGRSVPVHGDSHARCDALAILERVGVVVELDGRVPRDR